MTLVRFTTELRTTTILMNEIVVPDKVFFRIGEVARLLDVKPHVLRFWETEFHSVTPKKSSAGQRVYLRKDVDTLVKIRRLLYEEKYSIDGARKKLSLGRHEPTQNLEVIRSLVEQLRLLSQAPLSNFFRF